MDKSRLRRVLYVPLHVKQVMRCNGEREFAYFVFSEEGWWDDVFIGYRYNVKPAWKAFALLHEYGHYLIYLLWRFLPKAHLWVQGVYDGVSFTLLRAWGLLRNR